MLLDHRDVVPRGQSGFSMLELVIAMLVLAIAASIAVPSFNGIIKETRARAQTRSVVEAIEVARSSAVTRRSTVDFCASTDLSTCAGDVDAWASGWVVRDTADGSVVLKGAGMSDGATLTSASHTVTFNSFGEIPASTQLTVEPPHCDGNNARVIDIVTTGLVNVQPAAC